MASMCKVSLIGNCGRDPETRYTQTGTKTVNFSVAVNDRRRQADGSYQESVEWYRVTTFGRLAEICEQYVSKGRTVYVDGRLRLDRWTGQDGQARATLDVVASDVVLMGARQDEQAPERRPEAVTVGAKGPTTLDPDLDELPF
jgi:single-strand DNA-binding protein